MALQESKLLMMFLLILSIKIDATYEHAKSGTVSSSSSSWLKKVAYRPRHIGCWKRPLMCSRGVPSEEAVLQKSLCRCLCTDTNIDPFNCGSCGNVCSLGNLCVFGLCGYAQQPPPPPLPPSCPPTPPSPPPPCPPIYAASTVRSSSSAL
ncbi:stigma-specific STIG1-like protein 4 [Prosopis cineraria]|uniref:stigma-specific STIG1-like protein 4 n=1 Tax=Prosopis cineraria TaxID=364024 RepID=UPI00240FAEFD|nr:stigma-specific STIG1-like protein 4 [Prosopis cineraria]